MSSVSRSRSRSRSRSPLDRKIRSDRFSYRDAPYRRGSRRGYRFSNFDHKLVFSFSLLGWGVKETVMSLVEVVFVADRYSSYG